MENINWIESSDGLATANWTANGYDFVAKIVADEYSDADCDCLGSLDWKGDNPRKIRFAALGLESELKRAASWNRWYGASEYPAGYVPSENYPEDTPEHREYWKQDAKRLLECGIDWQYVGVTVTCSRAGVELGSDSVWAIEYDGLDESREAVTEAAQDCAAEALSEAEAKLAELRAN